MSTQNLLYFCLTWLTYMLTKTKTTMNIHDKKISVNLIVLSICTLIIAYLIKEPNDYGMISYLQEQKLQVPLYLYDINIIGLTLSYKSIVIIFSILLCIGVYWFLYKTDDEMKRKATKLAKQLRKKEQTIVSKPSSSQQVQAPQRALYEKIKRIKTIAFIFGLFILVTTFIIRVSNDEIANSLTTSGSQTFFVIMILLSILTRAIAAQLCYYLTNYNRGNKYLWVIFAVIMPSFSLIIAGMTKTLQYEYKYLYEFINQPKIK